MTPGGRSGLRVGIAVALVLLVLVLAAVLRRTGLGAEPGLRSGGVGAAPTAPATAGDDGEVAASPEPTPDEAAIRSAAAAFAAAWLRRDRGGEEWLGGLAPLATDALAKSLVGADPLAVPAGRVTGEPTIVLAADGFARAVLAVDAGTLSLDLVNIGGRWLVDGVDWERA